jgi:A/G-specific adenine glycosylase
VSRRRAKAGVRGTTKGAKKAATPVTTKATKRSRLPAISKARPTKPLGWRGAAPIEVAAETARDFSAALRRWFRRKGRDLPWRKTRDPYRILVSELMLQQTQVSRVIDYWHAFLQRFPTMDHVAEADERHVLEQWAGLGYYARARNLHRLARHVVRERPDRTLPAEPHELRTLPGVGAYTAGAVASFAYEKRAALVDTNVARVLARVFAPKANPKRPRDLARLWGAAERLLPRTGKAAWTHNQALMELGALVCTARVARCGECPVRKWCATGRLKTEE